MFDALWIHFSESCKWIGPQWTYRLAGKQAGIFLNVNASINVCWSDGRCHFVPSKQWLNSSWKQAMESQLLARREKQKKWAKNLHFTTFSEGQTSKSERHGSSSRSSGSSRPVIKLLTHLVHIHLVAKPSSPWAIKRRGTKKCLDTLRRRQCCSSHEALTIAIYLDGIWGHGQY